MLIDTRTAITWTVIEVFLNGVDISDDCYRADDEEGWADCYLLDEAGIHYVEFDEETGRMGIASERRHGVVTFIQPMLGPGDGLPGA